MFCAKLAKISGERLQDQWSSGMKNRGQTGAVVRVADFRPRVPGSSPGRCTVCCGLEQVTFTPCLVQVKPRKRWTDDRLGQAVTRL